LTLVLDETGCEEGRLRQEASYQQVNLNLLKELRIIIHKTPKWLDDIARRSTCSINEDFTIAGLASRMLGPVIHPIVTSGMIEITLYLFRQLDSTSIDALTAAIEADLSERQTSAGLDLVQQGRPRYTIKTLSDYISEGLEDELLPEELQYWREENQRRLKEGAGDFRAKQGGSERRQSRIPSQVL
jgi:PHD/YefM family antitoxin component YafN of YafNO toxin-antitoxin module